MLYDSSSSSCQQYLVYSSSDILKSMQQLNRLNKVQIAQDKTMESLHFSGRYWCCNFGLGTILLNCWSSSFSGVSASGLKDSPGFNS